MKKALIVIFGVLAATAGCSSTETTPPTMAAASSPRGDMVGTWTGALDSGASVRVTVPANGKISYSFKGQRVPVHSTSTSGGSLVSTLRAGDGGTVTLTPQGDKLLYRYSYQGNRASTTLTRS